MRRMSMGRGMRGWLPVVVVGALLAPALVGCGASTAEDRAGGEKTVVSGVASGKDTTVGATPGTVSDGEAEGASGADEFVAEGTNSGGSGQRADAVLGV